MKKNSLYSLTHIITYLTILHGVLYWLIKYYMKVETEYGLRPHEFQSLLQGAHIILSPALIFIFGLLFKEHILKMYKNALYKRKTGMTLTISMTVMILTGYLIQVVYMSGPKEHIAHIHIIVSLIFSLSYLIHHLLKR